VDVDKRTECGYGQREMKGRGHSKIIGEVNVKERWTEVIIIIIIKITEHLILHPKIQANSKAYAFLLPITFSTEIDMSFQRFLEGRERN